MVCFLKQTQIKSKKSKFIENINMESDHPKIKFGKTGVHNKFRNTRLTSWWDIKYLKEFLSDRRVIKVNPILWQIILNLFILTLDLLK